MNDNSKKYLKDINPLFNFIENLNSKHLEKEIKNRGSFCSTIKISYNWKELIKIILNNTEYNNDKR